VTVLFWALVGSVAYACIGYPPLLWLAVRVAGRRPRAFLPGEPARLPGVTVVLPAHSSAVASRAGGWGARETSRPALDDVASG